MNTKIKNGAKTFNNSRPVFTGKRRSANDNSQPADEIFRALFENSTNPLLLINDSFRFVKCNEAAVKLLGAISKDEVINKPPSFFSPKYQPDGQPSTIKAAEMIKDRL